MVQEEAMFPLCERSGEQSKQDCGTGHKLHSRQTETGVERIIADIQGNSALGVTTSPSARYSRVKSHFAKQPPTPPRVLTLFPGRIAVA